MLAAWLRWVFKELGWNTKSTKNVKIYGDNQFSLSLTENAEFHARTKHIAVKYHYLREEVQRGVVNFWYFSTNDLKVDGLIKPLPRVKFLEFVKQFNLYLGHLVAQL
jgi:hypothetical protein